MALSLSKLSWLLRRLNKQVWFRVTAFAVLGLATALASVALKPFIPSDLSVKIGADSVDSILQILASSMLSVTTFSLSILTAAYATAGSNATPRVVRLLVEDGTSQTVLSTFIGAFVFSLVGIILLQTGVYGLSGRLILFGATLLVVLIVVISLLRWIAKLGHLGRVEDNLTRAQKAAHEALAERLAEPWLGGNRMMGAPPLAAVPLYSDRIGHLQYCDVPQLSQIAEDHGLTLYLSVSTGDFVHTAQPLLHVLGLPEDAESADPLRAELLATFTIAPQRSFDQDPRQGLRVLSEIAQRALSPGINDPGTAELSMGRMVDVLGQWTGAVEPELRYPSIWVPSLEAGEMLQIAFAPIARDGAANFQIQTALQSALLALSQMAPEVFSSEALKLSKLALVYSGSAIPVPAQREALVQLSGRIADLAQQDEAREIVDSVQQYDGTAEKL
jgi:uncharacterized membrane protein